MFLWTCDRRQFLDFIMNRKPLSGSDVRSTDTIDGGSPRGDDIMLVWQKSPTDTFAMPRAVILAEGRLQDFLAWVSTYFRHIRPFTAHCRILTSALAQVATQSIPPPLLPDVRSADIGLILAEGIAYSIGRIDLHRLPFSAFARTLSFAYAEGAKRYTQMFAESGEVFNQIRRGWLSARELSNQPSLGLSPADISDVWALVLSAVAGVRSNQAQAQSEPLVVEALQEVQANGHVPRGTWTKLFDRFRIAESQIEVMQGPREGRVQAVEMAIRELAHGVAETRRHRAFIAGYMASRIQPGSLDHVPVLFPAMAELRESLLWYGACSGLTPETSVDNYGNGLGWLMKRELGRPSHWLDRPNCDIALSEMAILLRSREGPKLSLRTLTGGVLKVEIFPLISTSVRWSESGEDQISERDTLAFHQKALFDEDTRMRQDVSELLRRIDDSAMSLDAIRKRVESIFGEKAPAGRKRRK
jgi:hypothetical protein